MPKYCQHSECLKKNKPPRASYCSPDENAPKFCAKHKDSQMINITTMINLIMGGYDFEEY
jgi:hypothetical protein